MALTQKERNSTKLTEALVLARTRAADLESVRKLNCWASQIGDASIVRRMPNLEVCSLSVNNLTTLKDFEHCPSLQELYVRKNHIEQLSDVLYLKKLERLRFLWLSDNPCSQGDSYRMTVLRTLPNLQKLDNIAVTEEEINRALEEGSDLHHPGDPDPTNESPPEDENPMNEAMLQSENDNAKAPFAIYNTNTNANPAPTATHPTTDSATTSAGCSASVEPSSDDGDDKDEEEDSGVEASVNRLLPERSKGMPSPVKSHAERLKQTQQESVKLSWEETNQIRTQLGLKPLPLSKVSPHKSVTTGVTRARNANILQSVLLLLRELDKDSLEIVHNTVARRLEDL